MMGQLFNILSHHNKLFVLRFDLRQPRYQPDNRRITKFNRILFKRLKRKYRFKRIGFCWAREQVTSAAPHYHYVLFLDGSRVDYSDKLLRHIHEVWGNMSGTYYVPQNCFYHFHRSDDTCIRDVIKRISYFAKARSKGMRPPQTKDYSTSRIKQKEP